MAIYLGYDRVGIIKTVKVKVFANTTTVSGTYSVVLNNSIGDEVDQLIIDGNSVQNGTPTPETPIEIESVGDLGKNLCGGRNVLINKLIGNSANGIIVDSTVYNTMYIEVEEGQTYSFTGFVRADGSSLKGCFYDSEGNWVSAFEPTTVTIPTGVKYVGRSFNNTVEQVQFEIGQPTEYEPYGYRIPVVSKGKNLLDSTKAETGSLVAADGSNYEKTNRARSPFVYLKKGTYTISMSSDISATTMFFYSKPEPSGYFIGKYATTPVVENEIRFATFPVEQDCYMRCVFVPEDESKITDLGGTTLSNYNVMVAETKNLFDINTAENGTINQNNGTDLSADTYPNRCRSGFIKLSAGSYLISFSELISTGNYLHCYSSDNVSSWIKSQAFAKSGSVSKFTLDSDCYIRFTIQPINTSSSLVLNTETLKQYQPQLLKSITATDYESYIIPREYNIVLNEPLRKIGDFADYVDYKNGLVVRKIASEFLDTVTTMSGDATTYKKFLTDIKYKPYLTYQGTQSAGYSKGYAISNKFKQSSQIYNALGSYTNLIQTYITTSGINRCVYTFDNTSINTVAKAQAQIGDGFEVCYVTEQEREEKIEFPMILTRDVETIFEVDTEIKPTKFEVSYWEEIK